MRQGLYYLKNKQTYDDWLLVYDSFLPVFACCDLKIVLNWYEIEKTILWTCTANHCKSW